MDQLLLSIKVIITPVFKPIIVKNKILLILRVIATVVFNPGLFHNFHLILNYCIGPTVAYYKS